MQVVAYTLCLFTLRKNCQERRKTLQVKLFQVIAIFGLIGFTFYQTAFALIGRWLKFDELLSHGLVVIAMTGYLLAKNLNQDPEKQLTPAPIIFLALLSLIWFVFKTLNIDILEQLILIPILAVTLWCLIGTRSICKILPIIALLIFAIPIWGYLAKPLVFLSTQAVTSLIELTNLTAFIEGNRISLPFGVLVIADGCSGIRYLTVALAISYYLYIDSIGSLKKKLFLILASFILGIVSNWVRIYLITLIAYESDMQSGLVKDHELFGWIVFALMFSPILYFGGRLRAKRQSTGTIDLLRNPRALIFMLVSLLVGPTLYAINSQNYTAPKLSLVSQADLKNIATHDDFIFPKSKMLVGNIENSQVKSLSVINWRASNTEDLVPYWPQKFSKKWIETKTLDWPINNQTNKLSASFYRLSSSNLKLKRCVAISYETGGVKTSSYVIAKLAQIPALLLDKNYFIAHIVYADTKLSTCKSETTKLVEALQNLNISAQ
jgi:exosortase